MDRNGSLTQKLAMTARTHARAHESPKVLGQNHKVTNNHYWCCISAVGGKGAAAVEGEPEAAQVSETITVALTVFRATVHITSVVSLLQNLSFFSKFDTRN